MKDSERAISTMCDCILKAIDKRIAELKCDREAIVLEGNDNKYTVLIDNCRCTVKNGTPFEFQKNDKCLVHFINGNQQRKIIIAKLQTKKKGDCG